MPAQWLVMHQGVSTAQGHPRDASGSRSMWGHAAGDGGTAVPGAKGAK